MESKLLDLAYLLGELDGYWGDTSKTGDLEIRESLEKNYPKEVLVEANKIMLEQLSFREI